MFPIWSLVPRTFLKPAWTSGSSRFKYYCSLAWTIVSITLLVCDISEIVQWFEHSLILPFFGIGMKTNLFQSCESATLICQQICKTQQWPQDWKWSNFIPIPKKGNIKECSNSYTVALISHASVMIKMLQARLRRMWTKNFQMYKVGLEKAEEPEIQLQTFVWSYSKGISVKYLLEFHWLH